MRDGAPNSCLIRRDVRRTKPFELVALVRASTNVGSCALTSSSLPLSHSFIACLQPHIAKVATPFFVFPGGRPQEFEPLIWNPFCALLRVIAGVQATVPESPILRRAVVEGDAFVVASSQCTCRVSMRRHAWHADCHAPP